MSFLFDLNTFTEPEIGTCQAVSGKLSERTGPIIWDALSYSTKKVNFDDIHFCFSHIPNMS